MASRAELQTVFQLREQNDYLQQKLGHQTKEAEETERNLNSDNNALNASLRTTKAELKETRKQVKDLEHQQKRLHAELQDAKRMQAAYPPILSSKKILFACLILSAALAFGVQKLGEHREHTGFIQLQRDYNDLIQKNQRETRTGPVFVCGLTSFHRLPFQALLIGAGDRIFEVPFSANGTQVVSSGYGQATALTFDFRNRQLIVTDMTRQSIISVTVDADKVSIQEVVKSTLADGVALDWIYGNLYWTELHVGRIMVTKITGSRPKTLINSAIHKPRAIVVDPRKGWLFWSDWGNTPKIEKLGMDGSQRSILISSDVVWPNGLSIDYATNELYWIDGRKEYIAKCDFNGKNKAILFQSPHISAAFGITVLKGLVYWAARLDKSVFQFNITSKENKAIVNLRITDALGLVAFHQDSQPTGTNHCSKDNGGCSHFCLAAPQKTSLSPKLTCACPDGSILREDKKTCTT